jgi:predicted NBD/HSP70 family sugar kinase
LTLRTAADIRRSNLFEVLRRVSVGAPISRQELVAGSSLSLATVASIVTELLERGLLVESGSPQGGKGRPLSRIAIDPGFGYFVGVDVAETYVHAEVFDASLRSVGAGRTALDGEEQTALDGEERTAVDGDVRTPEYVVATISRLLQSLSRHVPERGTIRGVGISVPGLVDDEGGESVFAPNWDWHQVPLRQLLRKSLAHPVHLDNPLKALVVSEVWRNPETASMNLAMVNLGTGVGAGLAIAGELYRGATNSAGEWGHTTVSLDGRLCRCGSRGCVEAYVGAPGILQHYHELEDAAPLEGHGQTAQLDSFATLLAARDPHAHAAVATAGRYLGAGLANLVNTFNPQRVVLAGWVSDLLGPELLSAAREELEKHALARPLAAVQFAVHSRAGNPVARGAATFALEAALTEDHTEGQR